MKLFKLSLLSAAACGALSVSAPAQAQAGTQFIAQISPMGFNFCPRGWASTDGQLLPINNYQALFSLVGTTYGGDGRTSFGLPDLRGRTPVAYGTGAGGAGTYVWGQKGGTTSFTLTVNNLPSHNHTGTVGASPTAGDTTNPVRNSFAISNGVNMYLDGAPALNNMHSNTLRINNAGGNLPVNKVSPYLAVNWCIALEGIFPSRN
jgi:microcystin-dependent protein